MKEHTSGELNYDRLFLVFFLPSVNRQSHEDVLYEFITETVKTLQLRGKDKSWVVFFFKDVMYPIISLQVFD